MLRSLVVSGAVLAFFAATEAQAKEIYFRTPSKNIYCAYMDFDDAPSIRCDIRNYTPSFRRPGDCDLDYGYAFEITPASRRGAVLCAGDTVMYPDARQIGYGKTFREGSLSCKIEQSGVTCTNAKGHGFFVAKAKQKVF